MTENVSPIDVPYQDAVVNISELRALQDKFSSEGSSILFSNDFTLVPAEPQQATKFYSNQFDVTYDRRLLPDHNDVALVSSKTGKTIVAGTLRYEEVSAVYEGSDGQYYVGTAGRLFVPHGTSQYEKLYDGPYKDVDPTLWAPGTGALQIDRFAPPAISGTFAVDPSWFNNVRLATPEEIAAAEAQQQWALDNGFTKNSDGTWTPPNHCFLGDTPIQMWPLNPSIQPHANGSFDEQKVLSQIWQKPISEIQRGDIVVSYDEHGRLAPKPVVRTMVNSVVHVLDFWGTGTTPGHAYYCAEGMFKGQHVPIIDILRTDGAIMCSNGKLIRAATNCEVGSLADKFIHVTALKRLGDGSWAFAEEGTLRFGTRLILPDGRHMSLMEMAAAEGWQVSDDGYMVSMVEGDNGQFQEQKFSFPYEHGETLPKPEAYILSRSAVTLEEIYAAGEWEEIGTRMPAPAGLFDLTKGGSGKLGRSFKLRPNVPPAFANRPDAPSGQIADQVHH